MGSYIIKTYGMVITLLVLQIIIFIITSVQLAQTQKIVNRVKKRCCSSSS